MGISCWIWNDAWDESLCSIPVLLISLLGEDPEREDEFPAFFQRGKIFSWRNRTSHFQKFGMFGYEKFSVYQLSSHPASPRSSRWMCRRNKRNKKKREKRNKSRWRNVWNDSLGIKEWQFICAWNLQFPAWKPNRSPIMEIWAGSRQGFDFFRM